MAERARDLVRQTCKAHGGDYPGCSAPNLPLISVLPNAAAWQNTLECRAQRPTDIPTATQTLDALRSVPSMFNFSRQAPRFCSRGRSTGRTRCSCCGTSTRSAYTGHMTFTKAQLIRPNVAYCVAGKVNSAGKLYLVIQPVRPDTDIPGLPQFPFLPTAWEVPYRLNTGWCPILDSPADSFCPALRIRVRQLQNRRCSQRQNRRFRSCFRPTLPGNSNSCSLCGRCRASRAL